MRLLNVRSLELEEYFGDQIPAYAILSHTWGQDELKFEQWMSPSRHSLTSLAGYIKITGACTKASKDGYAYLWIDTICIDKRSSAELSEAINSMYEWYRRSSVCYAYLVDVVVTMPASHENSSSQPDVTFEDAFKKSKWFTRGWTLQELIAPSKVHFYNATWDYLGDKRGLASTIANITGIHYQSLDPSTALDLDAFSIAQRMSWASGRVTTRIEDMAYCLLGIFRLNMPLLYGEGTKAFARLQEEIIRVSVDQSIFAWSLPDRDAVDYLASTSLLAPSPKEFGAGRYIVQRTTRARVTVQHYSMTNAGLQITLPVLHTFNNDMVLALLNCKSGHESLCIPLRCSGGVWTRARFPPTPFCVPSNSPPIFRTKQAFYLERNSSGAKMVFVQDALRRPTWSVSPPPADYGPRAGGLALMMTLSNDENTQSRLLNTSLNDDRGRTLHTNETAVFYFGDHPEEPGLKSLILHLEAINNLGRLRFNLLLRRRGRASGLGWCQLVSKVIDSIDHTATGVFFGADNAAEDQHSPDTFLAAPLTNIVGVDVSLVAEMSFRGETLVVLNVSCKNTQKRRV